MPPQYPSLYYQSGFPEQHAIFPNSGNRANASLNQTAPTPDGSYQTPIHQLPRPSFGGGRGKRKANGHSGVENLGPGHKYYKYFRYSSYVSPKCENGRPMGQSSMDHKSDSEMHVMFGTTLFQIDPIGYWTLRDVAEYMPTKINEKEKNYLNRLKDSKIEPKGKRKGKDEPVRSLKERIAGKTKPRAKRTKRDPDEESDEKSLHQEDRQKAVKNWNGIYTENYKLIHNVEPVEIPSHIPSYRQTVHAVINAGKPDDMHGPQDINTCFINTIRRCEDPEFRDLLIEKLKSIAGPCYTNTTDVPPVNDAPKSEPRNSDDIASENQLELPNTRIPHHNASQVPSPDPDDRDPHNDNWNMVPSAVSSGPSFRNATPQPPNPQALHTPGLSNQPDYTPTVSSDMSYPLQSDFGAQNTGLDSHTGGHPMDYSASELWSNSDTAILAHMNPDYSLNVPGPYYPSYSGT
ncbi:hypothetical protein ABW19_dt0202445 [Dactylella cylindrospora]|nr:hypothetical protein ABW19_dt0202445 [Dactylella cylindrospora]